MSIEREGKRYSPRDEFLSTLNILTREKGFLFDRTCVEGYRRSVWISMFGVDGTRILHDTEYFSNRSLFVPIVPYTFPPAPLYISAQPYPPVLSFFLVTRFIFFLFFFCPIYLFVTGRVEWFGNREREREREEKRERKVSTTSGTCFNAREE